MRSRNRLRKILVRTPIGAVSLVFLGFRVLTGAMVHRRPTSRMNNVEVTERKFADAAH